MTTLARGIALNIGDAMKAATIINTIINIGIGNPVTHNSQITLRNSGRILDRGIMKRLGVFLALMFCLFMLCTVAQAQISLTSPSYSYSQNFDGIGTTATATLPTGFRADKRTTSRQVNTYSAAGTATEMVDGADVSSTATNGIYNFGSGTTDTGSDRSIGFLSSSTATKSGNLYAQFTNNTGTSLASIVISYNVEKYRNGSNPAGYRFQLFYSTNDSTYTSAGASFTTSFSADADNNGFNPAPGSTTPVSGILVFPTPIANGSSFYLAFNYSVTSTTTTSNAQALAIDDFSIRGSQSATAAKLGSFTATNINGHVVVEWKTGYEVENLGFNIYRETGGKRTRVNPSLLAGSAFLAGQNTRLTAGNSYAWKDSLPRDAKNVRYYLEDIDLNGTRTLHGPITPVYDEKIDASEQAKLLSQIQAVAPLVSAWPAAQSQSANGTLGKSAMLAASAEQSTLAGRAALKLGVRRDGLYRVSGAQLAAAGFDTTGNASRLQLYADGVEVPLKVSGDGKHLTASDSVEFYGRALDTINSDTRTYWLVAGETNGKRINIVGGNQSSSNDAASAQSFAYTVERRDRTVYFAALQNGDGNNFFGAVVTATPVSQTLNVSNQGQPSGAATLELTLQGATAGTHSVRVQLNNQDLGTMTLSDRENKTARLSVDQATLAAGDNTLTLTAMNGDADVSAVDRVRLTYAHAYRADNDTLRFSLNNRQSARVDGFSISQVRVFDITNPASITEVTVQTEATANGFAFNLQSTALRMPGTRILLAVADNQITQPAQVVLNEPSSLKTAGEGADLVIITHSDFIKSAERLAEARRAQGLSVAVVDVEDIYDEFSYGAHSTQAVTDFLAWTQNNWTLAPRFAILLGDASFDPRNYLGVGQFDFVPTKLVDTVYLETASDDTLADFDNDGIAEMAIGRLPVRTPEQAAAMVSKLINYVPGSVSQNALLVSDVDPNFDFAAANATAGALLPQGITVNTIDRGQQSTASVRTQIINGLNQGPMLVNYVGHGSTEQWAGAGLLTSSDAPTLTNGGQLPLMTMMTCLNGFYQDVYTESLAEALMKAQNGGAVAVWASSGLTTPEEQALMNQELFHHLFAAQGNTLGESVHAAKSATQDRDVRRTWILFGDPTMKLR